MLLWDFAGERMVRISPSVLKRRAIGVHSWRENARPDVPLSPPGRTIHVSGTALLYAGRNEGLVGNKQLADQRVIKF